MKNDNKLITMVLYVVVMLVVSTLFMYYAVSLNDISNTGKWTLYLLSIFSVFLALFGLKILR